jgi:cell division protease FtsH
MAADSSAAQPPRPAGTPSVPPPPTRLSWLTWVISFVLLGLFAWRQYGSSKETQLITIGYSDFYQLAEAGKVANVAIKGQNVAGALKGPETVGGKSVTSFSSMLPPQEDRDLLPLLREKGVSIDVKSEEQPLVVQILVNVLPWMLILGAWLWLSRRAQGMLAKNPLARMVRGPTRRYEVESQVPVKFDDVAGLKAAKQDLREIVDFLKEPARFQRLGGKVPRGVLLIGPPGTGKTLLARAVAGEAGVPFFSISGSEFIELFVGVGASRVRALFEEAKKDAPSIVFIDEIDAVGRSRGTGLGGGNDEREQTLNQLLAELDGFTRNDLTVVMAATNRPDVLDTALMRPGRFDRRIVVDRPERAARRAILEVHSRGKPIGKDVDLDAIAGNTPGFSGADLANLVNEAALSATRRHADTIDARDFTHAFDKIVLGDVRETLLDADEKKRVAVHEAGHAVVAHFTPRAEPLERVSILPRGMALGVTHQAPNSDKHLMTQSEIDARLRLLMGGYAAETVILGAPSSGAENDLRRATELAIKMVAHFGMSENVGPVFYEHHNEHPFLGQMIATEGGTSDATVHLIEQEARRLLGRAAEDAKKTIAQHRDALDRLVAALLAVETVERAELLTLLGPSESAPAKPKTAGEAPLPEA